MAVLARQVATLMAGHNLIRERSGTPRRAPRRVATMRAALLPLIATEKWLARHRTLV